MDDDGNEQTVATENMDERYFFLYTDDEAAFKLALRDQILKAIGADWLRLIENFKHRRNQIKTMPNSYLDLG